MTGCLKGYNRAIDLINHFNRLIVVINRIFIQDYSYSLFIFTSQLIVFNFNFMIIIGDIYMAYSVISYDYDMIPLGFFMQTINFIILCK